ncbi:hypothetical protein [Hymenobacter fodinae]|uniref:DUF1735 domain-containing protein n=1 Tax=Hymenobacter fodinae TaxID=2510796 RepID=A0A4Z0P3K2_9BACT|nr:hypothetical protein [Hymenobacter fodinae]TGE04778.1 hypothetical protein EU556_21595 [Hymenobacter fodinae]
MFNTLRVIRLLLSSLFFISLLTACGEDDEKHTDPTPKHYEVQVRYTATNLMPNKQDVGATINVLITDAKKEAVKSRLEATLTGRETDSGINSATELVPTDNIKVDLSFTNVSSQVEAKQLPDNTQVTVEILLNNNVARTIRLDKFSTVSSNKVSVMEELKVSDL